MPKKLARPQITVAGVTTPGLPAHTLISMKDHMAAEILYWRERQAQNDATMSAKQAELDKAEVTIRNQELELRRLRNELKELKHRYDALDHWSR